MGKVGIVVCRSVGVFKLVSSADNDEQKEGLVFFPGWKLVNLEMCTTLKALGTSCYRGLLVWENDFLKKRFGGSDERREGKLYKF